MPPRSIFIISVFGFVVLSTLLINALWFTPYNLILAENSLHYIVPVGEIITGTEIIQPILLPESFVDSNIAIEILMATYKRKNNSQIEIALTQENIYSKIVLNTNRFADNAYQTFMFYDKYKPGLAYIKINGIDGTPGNAVTAWLTRDLLYNDILIDGVPKEYNLVSRVGIPTETPAFNMAGGKIIFWAWVLTYIMVILSIGIYFIKIEPYNK